MSREVSLQMILEPSIFSGQALEIGDDSFSNVPSSDPSAKEARFRRRGTQITTSAIDLTASSRSVGHSLHIGRKPRGIHAIYSSWFLRNYQRLTSSVGRSLRQLQLESACQPFFHDVVHNHHLLRIIGVICSLPLFPLLRFIESPASASFDTKATEEI
jgi:hypothetical protein